LRLPCNPFTICVSSTRWSRWSIAISHKLKIQALKDVTWPLHTGHSSFMGETSTVREPPKALSTKPLECECASRFRKEAVAELIALGMVTSRADCRRCEWDIAKRSPGISREIMGEAHRPNGSRSRTATGLKIESALTRKSGCSLFEQFGASSILEAERAKKWG
jgi:hypothetical protein